ncbi:MAG: hypothetical protein WBR21_08445 [Rouxiella badensis]|uniref:hypothetical protein n=1 Tax=Rouxiella badensis TaxID=1646377 RepID=UPI003C4DAE16
MSKETGGPAFPNVPSDIQYETWDEGMTLRDYFAAKSMQATQSNSDWSHLSTQQHAEYAYGVADAMLEARNK